MKTTVNSATELARAPEDSAHASGLAYALSQAVQQAAWVAVKKTPTA